jgi:hypothetical protein
LSPKVFELIAQDQQARQAVIDLQNAGIPAKDFTVNAGVDGALGTVDDLIQYVDKSGATVTVDSTVKPATAAVAGLTSTTDSTTATTTTKTDTAPAAQAVNQLAAQTNATQAYIQVGANLGGFSQAMTQIMSPVRSITFSILGNTDPVMSAIRSVTNGSYTATINVTANVSQAQAAIASIPRSLAITAPPAPVPAPGLSTFGAPTLAGASTRAASASTNVNYNITLRGGITDPDGAARAIGKVLDSRARRSSSVVAR